jgi:hypothetical protein
MNCPPYQDCTKQPDFFFVVGDSTETTVAFEAGWSESLPRLRQDMGLLLRGSGGSINQVVAINWTKRPGNYVAGVVQVYVLDQFGCIKLEQEQVRYRTLKIVSCTDPSNFNRRFSLVRRTQLLNPSKSKFPGPICLGRRSRATELTCFT